MLISGLAILCVALGGALGSVARFLLATWVMQMNPSLFPWGTLTVNLLGSFLFGFLVIFLANWFSEDTLKWLLLTGFLGGFTTFSTFAYETVSLLHAQRWLYAFANIGLTLSLCFLGVWLGLRLAR